MPYQVVLLDALQLRHARRRRGASGGCIETYHHIGFAGEDEISYDEATSKLYRSIHWLGENWRRVEYVLAGIGDWEIPRPLHPDCLVVREPCDGEVFDSETELLWLAPGKCVELGGTLTTRLLQRKHGEVVGPLDEFLDCHVFEECLCMLTTEFGHEIQGDVGRFLIDELTRRVGAMTLLGADEEMLTQIAEAVNLAVLRLTGQQTEDSS